MVTHKSRLQGLMVQRNNRAECQLFIESFLNLMVGSRDYCRRSGVHVASINFTITAVCTDTILARPRRWHSDLSVRQCHHHQAVGLKLAGGMCIQQHERSNKVERSWTCRFWIANTTTWYRCLVQGLEQYY
jgi:hypothetical protein